MSTKFVKKCFVPGKTKLFKIFRDVTRKIPERRGLLVEVTSVVVRLLLVLVLMSEQVPAAGAEGAVVTI